MLRRKHNVSEGASHGGGLMWILRQISDATTQKGTSGTGLAGLQQSVLTSSGQARGTFGFRASPAVLNPSCMTEVINPTNALPKTDPDNVCSPAARGLCFGNYRGRGMSSIADSEISFWIASPHHWEEHASYTLNPKP